MAIITSKQWRLNAYDYTKALLVAALSQPVYFVLGSLARGNFNIDWKAQGVVAISMAATYLLKNLGTPSKKIITNVSPDPSNN